MKKLITVTILTIFLSISFGSLAQAQDTEKDLGIGFMVGEPTGISLKSWTSGNNAFDLGLSWSFVGPYEAINIHGDYLWHNYDAFSDVDSGTLPLYYGIGGRVIFAENDAVIGARVPVGLNYLFEDSPIGLFIEVAPVLDILPSTDFHVNGGVGVRFYL